MNPYLALIDFGHVFEFGMEGLLWAINAGMAAAMFACAVLVVDLVSRRWLTAGQKNLLWGLVLIRLLMPMAPASYLSLQNLSLPAAIDAAPNEPADWLPAIDGAENEAESPGPYSAAERAASIELAAEWENRVGQLLTLAWVSGALFMLVWTAIVHFRFSRRVRRAPVCTEARIVELWNSCRGQIGLRRAMAVVECDAVRQPALMGFWRPKLLLPRDVTELGDDQLRMIMLHELAHVRRLDIAWNWLLVLIRAIHWWNPVYWLGAARFANLREQACDAFVVRRMAGEPARAYSELLLTLAEREPAGRGWRVTLPASILGFVSSFFRKRAIRQRLRALRSAGAKPGWARSAVAAGAIALVAICGLTDEMPPREADDVLDWVPAITMDLPATNVDPGPMVVREYDVAEVLARIDADENGPPNFGWLIANLLHVQTADPTRGGEGAIDSDSEDEQPAAPQTMFTLDGNLLTVRAPSGLQDELAENLKSWQQSGLGQISVRCRFMTASNDIASAAGVSWRLEEARSTETSTLLTSKPPAGESPVRAVASVSESFPVMVATLSKDQEQALLRSSPRQSPWFGLQCPTVTVFNGQSATIGDCRQTPFVVGIQKNPAGVETPIIRIVEEGTRLTYRIIHSSDRRHVHLKGCMEISKLGEVRLAQAMFGDHAATVQVPNGRRWRIEFDSTVADGQSVLIGFVPSFEQKVIVYALVTVQTVEPQPAVAAN